MKSVALQNKAGVKIQPSLTRDVVANGDERHGPRCTVAVVPQCRSVIRFR